MNKWILSFSVLAQSATAAPRAYSVVFGSSGNSSLRAYSADGQRFTFSECRDLNGVHCAPLSNTLSRAFTRQELEGIHKKCIETARIDAGTQATGLTGAGGAGSAAALLLSVFGVPRALPGGGTAALCAPLAVPMSALMVAIAADTRARYAPLGDEAWGHMKKAEALKALLGARKDGDCAPRKIDMPFVEYSALIKDVLANGCTNSEKTKQLLEEETH